MKKLLSIIMTLFTLLSFLCVFNGALAQEQPAPGNIKQECITSVGSNCFDYEELVFGEGSDVDTVNEHKTILTVVQDAVLASTYIVGTILTIVIIYCGIMYIVASGNDSMDTKKYKTGLIYAGIGAVLVWGAYTIVRLIQYIAKGSG